jgi:hypothetical protein
MLHGFDVFKLEVAAADGDQVAMGKAYAILNFLRSGEDEVLVDLGEFTLSITQKSLHRVCEEGRKKNQKRNQQESGAFSKSSKHKK